MVNIDGLLIEVGKTYRLNKERIADCKTGKLVRFNAYWVDKISENATTVKVINKMGSYVLTDAHSFYFSPDVLLPLVFKNIPF